MAPSFSGICREQIHTWIRRKARTVLGQAGIRYQDLDDIQQTLWVRLLTRIPSLHHRHDLDPYRPWIERILNQGLASLLRDRRAQKRSSTRTITFSALPFPIEQLLYDPQATSQGQVNNDCDWQSVWNALPSSLQSMLLQRTHSNRYGLRKALGLNRYQFRQLFQKLQSHFTRFGYGFGDLYR